jgi:hypothetical protein
MRESLITCKECKFWIQFVEEDPKLGLGYSSFGICLGPGSDKWFLRMHKDLSCDRGEFKEKELLP